MKLLIKNGRVIDPYNGIDEKMDVFIDNGRIAAVKKEVSAEADRIIDADGLWVVPGLIDLHVHFREPGFEYKETIATGALAAARGGFTTVCCMPNTDPVVDNEFIVDYIKQKALETKINILPIGSVTRGQMGQELSNIGLMAEHGICAISEDGKTVENSGLYKTAMKYAAHFGLPVFSHCEDKMLSGGAMNAGERAAYLGLSGISKDSEEIIIARDIILAENVGGTLRLHICHISTAGGVRLLRDAKARGINVTGEAVPHHFTLTDNDITDYDTNFKMSPPLRGPADLQAIKEGLKDGTIDCIATDHAPHHHDEKNCEFALAANGIVGLETAVALTVTELVTTKFLTPMQLVEKMSLNPAKILGTSKGTLSETADADVTIIDPGASYKIDIGDFVSKGKNSPFGGREVFGRVMFTICGGEIVFEEK